MWSWFAFAALVGLLTYQWARYLIRRIEFRNEIRRHNA